MYRWPDFLQFSLEGMKVNNISWLYSLLEQLWFRLECWGDWWDDNQVGFCLAFSGYDQSDVMKLKVWATADLIRLQSHLWTSCFSLYMVCHMTLRGQGVARRPDIVHHSWPLIYMHQKLNLLSSVNNSWKAELSLQVWVFWALMIFLASEQCLLMHTLSVLNNI